MRGKQRQRCPKMQDLGFAYFLVPWEKFWGVNVDSILVTNPVDMFTTKPQTQINSVLLFLIYKLARGVPQQMLSFCVACCLAHREIDWLHNT